MNLPTNNPDSLFLGYEVGTGKPVEVEIFHMLVTGQTQKSGKTTCLKALATQVVQKGYKVLILDTKTQIQDYEGFGEQIPVCVEQTTDALILRDLLESINTRAISKLQATLTTLASDTSTFDEVLEKAIQMRETPKLSSFKKDALIILVDLLKRLIATTKRVETTSELILPYDINRMTINEFAIEGQQLIANTVFKQVLKKFKRVVVILDEAHKFLPQKRSSPCKTKVQSFVTQSAITECFLWESTQFLAPTDKDAMKAMPIKLLGKQDHSTEVEHALSLIPGTIGKTRGDITKDTLMTLKIGHFILVHDDGEVTQVYVQPPDADPDDCIKVAKGLMGPKDINYVLDVDGETFQIVKEFKPIGPEIEIVPTTLELKKQLEDLQRQITALKSVKKPHPGAQIGCSLGGELISETVVISVKRKKRFFQTTDEEPLGRLLRLAEEGFFDTYKRYPEITRRLDADNFQHVRKDLKKALQLLYEEQIFCKAPYTRNRYQYVLAPNIAFAYGPDEGPELKKPSKDAEKRAKSKKRKKKDNKLSTEGDGDGSSNTSGVETKN